MLISLCIRIITDNSQSTMLFSRKHKRKVAVAWGIVSVVIILLMIALYMPILFTK